MTFECQVKNTKVNYCIQKEPVSRLVRYMSAYTPICVLIIKNYCLFKIYNEIFNFYQIKHFQNQVKRDVLFSRLFIFTSLYFYSSTTLTWIVLVICGCTHISTSYSPSDFIGSLSFIFFLSIVML